MNHNYKLRIDEVLEIKNQLVKNRGMNKIARDYDISLATVRNINQGKTHKDVGSFSYPIRKKTYIKVNVVRNPPKKISDDQAVEIYLRLEQGESSWKLSKEYGVSHPLIENIPKRPMFRHVDMFD